MKATTTRVCDFSSPDSVKTNFAVNVAVVQSQIESVVEHLFCFRKTNAMSANIAFRFGRIPSEMDCHLCHYCSYIM